MQTICFNPTNNRCIFFVVYQIVFEAVAGEGQVMDIAIDDLSVMNGPCSPHGKNSWVIPFIKIDTKLRRSG